MTGYFDHAATTDVAPEALAAYVAAAGQTGNASATHAAGRAARKLVEDARAAVADALGAQAAEVIFTSGGTEADNLAVKGSFWARTAADPTRTRVLISAVEHHAVTDAAAWLAEHEGAEVVVLPVGSDGVLDLTALAAELAAPGARPALVSVMWANHEVGAVQPIAEVVALAHAHGAWVHTDAVQAVGQIPVDFAASGVDALTISGHKLGAPIGVGALVARRELELQPLLHGGGQERGIRSGTLDVPAIAALGVALTNAVAQLPARARHLRTQRDALISVVRTAVPDAVLRGPAQASRLPANAHFTFPGCDADALLYLLDAAGISASAGAACQAGVARPSPVMLAMGLGEAEARGAIRFSVGMSTCDADLGALATALPVVVERARAAARVGG